tara:strand:+ start:321 stop:554 length:234 start_codon:yes stop_codon:yes gene_type:complete
MEKERLLKLFAQAVGVKEENISLETSTDSLQEWDSLGHLTFLSALDEETKGESSEISELTEAENLKEVNDILIKNNL